MKKLLTSDKIYISKSSVFGAGRGVFAKKDIKKGEIIETCPIIIVPEGDMSNLGQSILVSYFFYFGEDNNQLAIVLGFGSIYNHSEKPNAIYKINPTEETADFIAKEDIKKDCEINFDYYNGNPEEKKRPLWFEK